MHSTTLLGINALMGVGYELNYDQKSEPETNQESTRITILMKYPGRKRKLAVS